MPTALKKPVSRLAIKALDGCFGKDRNRRIVITLIPGTDTVADLIELRPHGTRRPERVAAIDVYRYALVRRVNTERILKGNARKAQLAARRASARVASADRRFKLKLMTPDPRPQPLNV